MEEWILSANTLEWDYAVCLSSSSFSSSSPGSARPKDPTPLRERSQHQGLSSTAQARSFSHAAVMDVVLAVDTAPQTNRLLLGGEIQTATQNSFSVSVAETCGISMRAQASWAIKERRCRLLLPPELIDSPTSLRWCTCRGTWRLSNSSALASNKLFMVIYIVDQQATPQTHTGFGDFVWNRHLDRGKQ